MRAYPLFLRQPISASGTPHVGTEIAAPALQIRKALVLHTAPTKDATSCKNASPCQPPLFSSPLDSIASILACAAELAMPAPPSSMSLQLVKCYCCSPSPSPKQQAGGSRPQPICNLSSPSLVAAMVHAGGFTAGGARLLLTRRAHAVSLLVGAAVAVASPAGRVRAEENDDGGEGIVGAIKSIFDPNEETKAGKVLPKAYLKAAREVVRTLRESLEDEDAGGDVAKFRRGADSAKASIREFLGGWRGQQVVAKEESYVALERAIRSLAEFYSKAGPFASLPRDVKNTILDDLSAADAYL